jgi:2-oxoglutarate ferredoxin oxidoreductase subunit beta
VFSYQGDGDAYTIGIAETLNAAYRNEKICVFVVNNGNFGMTGGQMAWTTLEGQKTATSPMGRNCDLTGYPIKVPELIANSFNVAYVARGAVTTPKEINKLKSYIRNAFEAQMNGEGYSLIEVMSTCPTNWGLDPIEANKRLVEVVIPYYELGELKKRGGE